MKDHQRNFAGFFYFLVCPFHTHKAVDLTGKTKAEAEAEAKKRTHRHRHQQQSAPRKGSLIEKEFTNSIKVNRRSHGPFNFKYSKYSNKTVALMLLLLAATAAAVRFSICTVPFSHLNVLHIQ